MACQEENLRELENRRHTINRQLRSIYNTYSWIMWGIGKEKAHLLEMEKSQINLRIARLRRG